jgi:3-dehydroquinate synthase
MTESRHPSQPGGANESWVTLGVIRELCERKESAVVVDRKVARLHNLCPPSAVLLSAGERSKSFSTLERLCGAVNERRVAGASRVVAVGGGTIGDVAALAAHLVSRGMPLVQVPTTLLAAVDSSIGGKAAVNSADGGKNLFGAFQFASDCLLCEEIWKTVPSRQRRDGLVEAAKMAVCLDAGLAHRWRHAPPGTREMVIESRRLKNAVCAADPFELGDRRTTLNFGHTVGHAIETLSGYAVSHGAAVAAGMAAALDVGTAVGATAPAVASWVEDFLLSLGLQGRSLLAQSLCAQSWEPFRKALSADKKGPFTFVLLRDIGVAERALIPEDVVQKLFESWIER